MKKITSIVLSICMVVMMSVPAFAYSSSDAMKVQLSDQAMTEAVGGTGVSNATINTCADGVFSVTVRHYNEQASAVCNWELWSAQNDNWEMNFSGSFANGDPYNLYTTDMPRGYDLQVRINCPFDDALNAVAACYMN